MFDARRLLQGLFVNAADILPDIECQRLRARTHNASTPIENHRNSCTKKKQSITGIPVL